jgi:hypothetical protein
MQKYRLKKRAISLFFLLLAVIFLAISSWPLPRVQSTQSFPKAYSLDYPELSPVELSREIFTSIPSKVRAGETDEIRFEFISTEISDASNTQDTAGETYLLETRLEMPGMEENPADAVVQPVIEGHTLRYTWQIQPGQAGMYSGTLWVYLLVMPEGSTEPDRRPVLALPVKVECVNTPVFNAKVLRILGGFCIAAAFFMVLLQLIQRVGGEKA